MYIRNMDETSIISHYRRKIKIYARQIASLLQKPAQRTHYRDPAGL